MIPTSTHLVKVSILGQRFTDEQKTLCSFFECNPTPARVVDTSDDDEVEQVQVASTATVPPHVKDKQEFYKMMVKTMQKMQHAPLQNQNIIVESRNHKGTINTAKLQISVVWLMYVTTNNVDWEDGTIKNVHFVTFTQECKSLLERSSAVHATQLTNLFKTFFSTEPKNDNDKEDDGGPLK